MNLETINTIAQLAAALGVIASLFYLAVLQLHSFTNRGRLQRNFDLNGSSTADPGRTPAELVLA